MNLIALIKQVPDMETVKFDIERGLVDRSSASAEINPFDLNAIEAAVQIKEQKESTITVVSMGPLSTEQALKEALSRGCDRGILLSDKSFGGSDTKATSAILGGAIQKLTDYDLIICGEKTVDGDTGQVGAEVAEYLGIPHAYYVERILEITDQYITVLSKEFGSRYQKKLMLPALISVTKDINTPRLPSFRSKMKSQKQELTIWGMDELMEFCPSESMGIKGSATQVRKIEIMEESKRNCKLFRGESMLFIDTLMDVLKEERLMEVESYGER